MFVFLTPLKIPIQLIPEAASAVTWKRIIPYLRRRCALSPNDRKNNDVDNNVAGSEDPKDQFA